MTGHNELLFMPATEIAHRIAQRELSPVEAMEVSSNAPKNGIRL